jgi:uncharacterized protein (TIGR02145 family)
MIAMKPLFKISTIFILLILAVIYFSSCKKEATLPTVTTTIVTDITQTTASSGGTVTDDGGTEVINRGVTWSITHNPTVGYFNTRDGIGIGTFLSKLSGLSGGTTYYVRAFATNNIGTGYGNEISFKSNDISLATLTTTNVTAITSTTAVSGGKIPSDGGTKVTEWGVCWSTSQNPTTDDQKIKITYNIDGDVVTDTIFTCNLTGLNPGTTYYVRAYAVNSVGTAYGNQVSFNAKQITKAATLTTMEVTSITALNAVSGGNVTDDGGGEIIAKGVEWGTSPDLGVLSGATGDGSGTGPFVSNLWGLNPKTTYYVRAYAITEAGRAFGPTISFTTPPIVPIVFNPDLTYGKVSDIDGNEYKTIQIGSQEWMAENLKTTKYIDGKSIPNVTDFQEWSNLTTDAYCWYKNDSTAYKASYGALYNWFTVNTGKLCPAGWHVPSDAEWTTLFTYLGGTWIAGSKMKEIGITHWNNPNLGATNESGFTAIPTGTLSLWADQDFSGWNGPGSVGIWWSASASINIALFEGANVNNSQGVYFKQSAYSVRCLKD